jgi:nitrous oxidase accessory protein NosD
MLGDGGVISNNIFEQVPATLQGGVCRVQGRRGVIMGNNIRGDIAEGIHSGDVEGEPESGKGLRIIGNYIETNSHVDSSIGINLIASDMVISGNHVKGFKVGLKITSKAERTIISGNNLTGNTTPMNVTGRGGRLHPTSLKANNLPDSLNSD